MRQWVLLEHTPATRPAHLDLMLERDVEAERRLVTFRLALGATLDEGQVLEAQRLEDHRAAYLDFEGKMSAGRGRIRRLVRGRCRVIEDDPACVVAQIEDRGAWRRLSCRPGPTGWTIEVGACEAP